MQVHFLNMLDWRSPNQQIFSSHTLYKVKHKAARENFANSFTYEFEFMWKSRILIGVSWFKMEQNEWGGSVEVHRGGVIQDSSGIFFWRKMIEVNERASREA